MTVSDGFEFEAISVQVADARTLLFMLKSPESSVLTTVCRTLTSIAETSVKNRLQLLDLGIIDLLLTLTKSPSVDVKKGAASCIAQVTEVEEIHPDMRKTELLLDLIRLTSPEENEEVKDEACFAISNLTKDFANNADFRKAGGLPKLVKLLSDSDADVQKNAAYAISIILSDSRGEFRLAKGLGSLLDILPSDHTEIQENALKGLIKCAQEHMNRVEIRKLGGLKKIVPLLESSAVHEVASNAAQLLAICLEDALINAQLAEINGVKSILQLLVNEEPVAKQSAALALSVAARDENNVYYIRDNGAIPLLINNIQNTSPEVIDQTAQAMKVLAENESNQGEMARQGSVEILLKACQTSRGAAKSSCLEALNVLGQNPKIKSKLRTTDNIRTLISWLDDSEMNVKSNVANVIATCADDVQCRADIVKENGTEKLISLLSSENANVKKSAAKALSRCLHDAENRDIFYAKEGLGPTIKMLTSKDPDVCRSAAYLLSAAALKQEVAIAACTQGAITPLIMLSHNSSTNMSKFANVALEKLLTFNLSAKLWLRGYLSDEDIICDTFYDMGGFSGGQNQANYVFPSLERLEASPIDKRRECLLVRRDDDIVLSDLMATSKDLIEPLDTMEDKIKQIAVLVAGELGGAVEHAHLSEFGYQFKITETKLKNKSNVIPIGQIKLGYFYHRALLFKVLCDSCGIASSLHRGDYQRAWNVVKVKKQQELMPVEMLVDLVHAPGNLMPKDGEDASNYMRIY